MPVLVSAFFFRRNVAGDGSLRFGGFFEFAI
jgi:hypothetical protein